MKTLKESLFDSDLVQKDIYIGDEYELSQMAHHNFFSNNVTDFFKCFDIKKFDKQLKYVDPKDSFIDYWDDKLKGRCVAQLIDTVLRAPLACLIDTKSFEKYLKTFIKSKYVKEFSLNIKKFPSLDWYGITIYFNIFSSVPNSLKILLMKK